MLLNISFPSLCELILALLLVLELMQPLCTTDSENSCNWQLWMRKVLISPITILHVRLEQFTIDNVIYVLH